MLKRIDRVPPRRHAAVCFAAIVAMCSDADAQGLPDMVSGQAQVYDGVTFDLVHSAARYRSTTRIRLESVDACEFRQKARLGEVDWPCGAVAAAWLVSQTLAKEVECRPTRVRRSGGFIAHCYVGGIEIGAAGLEQGMYVLRVTEGEDPPSRYREFEAKARAARMGIWSSEFMPPTDWRRAFGTYNPVAPQR
ncbi:thermonuclease family protein [Agrobacterium tumefaciens]|uniref:thermonuclease family protein n=1 Tax=Agrobacterium tumefaciens TaxID=358 RepID=UPI002243A483|nr:thermonuclease family protein [Agrobacterium tumefaciens]MCW8060569.1 thermonuclease family protein [Agrobacterium tumefaciens]MCW8146012.1 thermonuclease family protein [Agrobacterium tumefaciens]